MKRLFAPLILSMLILLISCQSSSDIRIYSEQELDLARQGIEEIALLSAKAAMTALPARIESLKQNDLFSVDFTLLLEEYRDTTGIGKRAAALEAAMHMSIETFMADNYANVDSLIILPVIDHPFDLINGESGTVTALAGKEFTPIASEALNTYLSQDEKVETSVTALLSILNSARNIAAYRNTEPSPVPLRSISYDTASASIVDLFLSSMAEEEEIIRSLAINYDSPAIQLFAR